VSAVVEGMIAVGFGRHVFRIEVATGDLVWLSAVAATIYRIAQDPAGIYIAANEPLANLSFLRLDPTGRSWVPTSDSHCRRSRTA